jgi:ribosome maturation protein Sdo1
MSEKKYQVVRYKAKNHNFEILLKPDLYQKYMNEKITLEKLLFSDVIYKNSQNGDKIKDEELM